MERLGVLLLRGLQLLCSWASAEGSASTSTEERKRMLIKITETEMQRGQKQWEIAGQREAAHRTTGIAASCMHAAVVASRDSEAQVPGLRRPF